MHCAGAQEESEGKGGGVQGKSVKEGGAAGKEESLIDPDAPTQAYPMHMCANRKTFTRTAAHPCTHRDEQGAVLPTRQCEVVERWAASLGQEVGQGHAGAQELRWQRGTTVCGGALHGGGDDW